MPWKGSLRRFWHAQRAAAVVAGVDEVRLVAVDSMIEDDMAIMRSHTEWSQAFQRSITGIGQEIVAAAITRPEIRRAIREHLGRIEVHMATLMSQWEADMQTSAGIYLLEYVNSSGGSPDLLSSLFDGVPRWQEHASEELFIMRDSRSVEARARAIVEVICDVTEMTYKPLLWNLTRLTRARLLKPPAAEADRGVGQIAAELRTILPHPQPPIVAFIDDDAVFIRNGVSHGRKRLPFDPASGRITIADRTGKKSYSLEELLHVLHYLFQRTRAMWLVFWRCSGAMQRERLQAIGGPTPPVAAP